MHNDPSARPPYRSPVPVVFVSHGAPDVLLEATDTLGCWRVIAGRVGSPAAILAVSAHWQGRVPTASMSIAPQTVHDFSGFQPELYRLHYPAPRTPGLAERVLALLEAAGIAADPAPARGCGHGAWVPLSVLYPRAHVPVMQLALSSNGGPEAHLALGRALAPLREEGVLILASGGITHNFSWLKWGGQEDSKPFAPAQAFADWVGERLAQRDVAALLDYRAAGNGAAAHPTEEHLLPLFVALGAAGETAPHRYKPRFTYGAPAMDAYLWE